MAGPDRFRNLQTDLFCIKRDFIGPKKMYILVTFVMKFVETITVVVVFFHDRSKHSHVLIQYPVITHVSSH